MNPIAQQLGRSQIQNNLGQIKQMMNTIRSAGNPQAMMQNMLSSNPRYKPVMDLIRQNGGDAKQAFYSVCQQKGINPQDVLNMLK